MTIEEMNALFSGNRWYVAMGRGRVPSSHVGAALVDKEAVDEGNATCMRTTIEAVR